MSEFLREISHDKKVPRQTRQINEDGLFETDDNFDPNRKRSDDDEQLTLSE